MSTTVLKNAYVSLNSVDLSSYVDKVTLTYKADMLDTTAMGDNTHVKTGGLKDWTIQIDFFEDNTGTGPVGELFGQIGNSVAVEIRPDAGTVSTTNPKYTGNGVIESVTPVDGQVGQAQKVVVAVQSGGDLTRATA